MSFYFFSPVFDLSRLEKSKQRVILVLNLPRISSEKATTTVLASPSRQTTGTVRGFTNLCTLKIFLPTQWLKKQKNSNLSDVPGQSEGNKQDGKVQSPCGCITLTRLNYYLLTLMSHPQKFSRIAAVYELKPCSVTAHPSLRLIGGSSHPRGLINNRVRSSNADLCANTGWLPLMDETKFDPRCLCAIGVDRKAG